MGSFGGFYKGEKKKLKKDQLEKKASQIKRNFEVPVVEIIGRKKGK